jgi:uncharacterized protein (DUF433 family)
MRKVSRFRESGAPTVPLKDYYDEREEGQMVRTEIDWTACELIEQIPNKVSGRPIVRDTRILPDAIVDSYDLGESIDELHEGFPALSVEQIKRLIEFAHAQRGQTLL